MKTQKNAVLAVLFAILAVFCFFTACEHDPSSQTVAKPTATPAGGTYTTAQTVTLTSATTGAAIFYTLDGTTPTATSTRYSSGITINETKTLKAIAVKSGMTDSEILTEIYTIGTSFPSSFIGAWKRDNFSNTLTFTPTTLKASNQYSSWNLIDVSGDSYTIARGTTEVAITIQLVSGNLEITGDSGTDENNWNGTWKPQPSLNNSESLIVDIDLGTMTEADSGWQQLLDDINTAGKYVNLDLSACTMNGTSFNPDSSVATGKDRIVSLVLPAVAESIEAGTSSDSTFKNFTSLTSVSGANITAIGNYAFYSSSSTTGNRNLQSVDFPQVTSIGNYAFYYCNSLESINFPQATTIGSNTFYSCTSLESVNLPQVTSIGNYAFYYCNSLESINFPQATTIGNTVFAYCTSLQSISLPLAANIGYAAFRDCTSLQSVSFPASVTLSTVNPTFDGCTSLTSFTLSGTGALSVIENGKVLVRDGTILIAYPSASGTITMNTITSIFNSALSGCTGLQSVSFPQVTSIGNSAFEDCTNLQSVDFPQATSIGNSAFSDCEGLQSADFPLVTTIGSQAFWSCTGLQSLNIPQVTSIGNSAFSYTGTAALVITMGSSAPTLGYRIFNYITAAKTVTVKVPTGATGYTPFSGTAVTVNSGEDENWANGLRGGGWTGTTWASGSSGGVSNINQNITVVIQQQ